MAIKIQLRRGTAAEWTSANPVLMQGEMGVETDTLKVKIGNGSTAWATLPYFTQGAKGDKGDQGIQGIQGVIGNTGPTGPVGPPNSLTVGTVTSGIEGSDAEVTITGTSPNQVMNLVIPRGDKGDAATIAVGTVTSVAAGQPVTVTNSGTSAAAVLNFEIPNAIGVPTGGVEGQIVRKTATATEWADMPPSQLSAQTDVTITSPQAKQVLKYDGAEWVNATASGGVTVSETSPADPSQGDGWFFAADGTQFVRYDDGTSVQWVQPNAVLSSQVEQRYYSPNYLINGGFDIWQRGTSLATGAYTYRADRWVVDQAVTVSRSTDVPAGIEAGYSMLIPAGTGAATSRQAIELPGTSAAGVFSEGKTFTLSFYAKSTASRDIRLSASFRNGVVGTNYLTVINDVSIGTSTSSWNRFSYTFTIPAGSITGATCLPIVITAAAGASADVFLTGVQLESGSTATAFRRNANSLQGELAACQRYYYRITGALSNSIYGPMGISTRTSSSTLAYGIGKHPVTMRTAVAGAWSNVTGFTVWDTTSHVLNGIYNDTYSEHSFTLGFTSTGFVAGQAGSLHTNSASASNWVEFNAEL